MKKSNLTIDKIKFRTDEPTFTKAVKLYQQGKVTSVQESFSTYEATVLGTQPYRVTTSDIGHEYGTCSCYLGQNDTLCKHMVALAIHVAKSGNPLTNTDIASSYYPQTSGHLGTLSDQELKSTKAAITKCLKYIKPYYGPSKTWFSYQSSLDEGCHRLAHIVSELPISLQTSHVLVNLALRLDRKLTTGGVDDSNGTVGDCIQGIVEMLITFSKKYPAVIPSFEKLKNQETCFQWEEPLLEILDRYTSLTPSNNNSS